MNPTLSKGGMMASGRRLKEEGIRSHESTVLLEIRLGDATVGAPSLS